MTKLMRERLKVLDAVGEEEVFRLYLELGTTRALIPRLYPSAKAGSVDYGRLEFWRWLQSDPGRWSRWQELLKLRAHLEAEKVLEIAEDATVDNASASRIKLDAHKWRAERLNREAYGTPSAQVGVVVAVGGSWLEALREVEAQEVKVKPPEPEGEEG